MSEKPTRKLSTQAGGAEVPGDEAGDGGKGHEEAGEQEGDRQVESGLWVASRAPGLLRRQRLAAPPQPPGHAQRTGEQQAEGAPAAAQPARGRARAAPSHSRRYIIAVASTVAAGPVRGNDGVGARLPREHHGGRGAGIDAAEQTGEQGASAGKK